MQQLARCECRSPFASLPAAARAALAAAATRMSQVPQLFDAQTGQPVSYGTLADLPLRQPLRTQNGDFVCRLSMNLVQIGGTGASASDDRSCCCCCSIVYPDAD